MASGLLTLILFVMLIAVVYAVFVWAIGPIDPGLHQIIRILIGVLVIIAILNVFTGWYHVPMRL